VTVSLVRTRTHPTGGASSRESNGIPRLSSRRVWGASVAGRGRVGRSAAAKELDEAAVRLAVIAQIRHNETRYDGLLTDGYEREDARVAVRERVDWVLQRWKG
jgi:hypothetical protein